MNQRLTEIEQELNNLFNAEVSCANEYKWNRALLYKEAKDMFPSKPQFGQWLRGFHSTAGGGKDSENVVTKLILCCMFLSKEEFISLGYAKSAELMNVTMWNKHFHSMKHLVSIGSDMTKMEIRDALKSIKSGEELVQPKPKPLSDKQRAIRFEKLFLTSQDELLDGDEFFDSDPAVANFQVKQLRKSINYCVAFFGLPPNFTSDHLSKAYKKASLKYHPDRGGSSELQTVVGEVKTTLENLLKFNSLKSSG